MSGFAAIFRFDGAPPDGASLAAMMDAIGYRGRDGRGEWADDRAAIGHLAFHTTPESRGEIQPLASEDGRRVLVLDGWFANAEELRVQLKARGIRLRDRSDAELALRAYEIWGEDCPRQLEGEFAFVVWDSSRQAVFCAKDHAGLRPLHYHWNGRRLVVASDLGGVLAAGDFSPRLNLSKLAQHVALEFYASGETVWAEVMTLQPAQTLQASDGTVKISRYWSPPLEVTLRYRCDLDYQRHYRSLLAESIRQASRTHLPLACDVSGGHDSSAVFTLASQLAASGALQAPSLRGYTLAFGSAGNADTDETGYARAVARRLGVEISEVTPFLPDLAWFASRSRADQDLPLWPNAAMQIGLANAMVADGCRVDLSGDGGDLLLDGDPFYYRELVVDRDWRLLAETLRDDVAALGFSSTLVAFLRHGMWPALPARLRAVGAGLRGNGSHRAGRRLLSPLLSQLLDQARADWMQDPIAKVANPARRSMIGNMWGGAATFVRDFGSRHWARAGYEVRCPFYARPLVEFAFSIPERQRLRGGVHKFLHLQALDADLPREVLERRDKASFGVTFRGPLDTARARMLNSIVRCGSAWLEVGALADSWNEFHRRGSKGESLFSLWAVVGLAFLAGWAEE